MYISCKLIVWWFPHAFPVDAHDIAVCSASFQKRKCFMLKQIKNEKKWKHMNSKLFYPDEWNL